MRRIVWLIVATAVAAVVVPPWPVAASHRFVDVSDAHTFHEEIGWLADFGITKGCNPPVNDRFCPDAAVTRGQMAAFLVRAMGYVEDGGGDLFVDDDGSIFEADIDKLASVGVTRGCNPPVNDRFCPDAAVTRGQMAAFMNRALTDVCLVQDSITRYECEAMNLVLRVDEEQLGDLVNQCEVPSPPTYGAHVWCDQGHVVGLSVYAAYDLPPQIGRLVHLTTLNVDGEYVQLPPEIGRLQALEELTLSNSAPLPDDIGSLQSLETLASIDTHGELWCGGEVEFPSSCYGNGLKQLPSTFSNLASLRTLDLRSNGFTTIPKEITDLTNLVYLNLSENPVAELPPEIAQMVDLAELYLLDAHYLSALPPEIGQLDNLRVLQVSGSLPGESLAMVPPNIGDLAALESLRLEGDLESLPPEIGYLSSLKELLLAGNRLTILVPEIADLVTLETLDLSGNDLQALIPSIGDLEALRTLLLNANDLSGPVPVEFLQLTALETLLLRDQSGCLIAATQELKDWLASFDPEWNDGCP